MPKYESKVRQNLNREIEKLEGLNPGEAVNEAYREYVGLLKKLNKATDEQYKKDGFGLARVFTEEDLEKFVKLYSDSSVAGEKLISALNKTGSTEIAETISNVQNILAEDLRVLGGVDKNTLGEGLTSFQKIMDDARLITVDISGFELSSVGGIQSSRIPFNYVDGNGNQLPGVFTAKKTLDVKAGLDGFLGEMEKKHPGETAIYKKYFAEYVNFERQKAQAENKEVAESDSLLRAMGSLFHGSPLNIPDSDIEKAFLKVLPREDVEAFEANLGTKKGSAALKYFKDGIGIYANNSILNVRCAGIKDKSRLDSRNSAMSSVAELLGVPELICKAFPMKVVLDGVETEGTFMCLAKGVDLMSPPEHCIKYGPETNVFNETPGMKSVADLQVIDFICGNIDRHSGNMFYQFDMSDRRPENHKFTGVQGIDNDTAFGTYLPKTTQTRQNKLQALSEMKVISESMVKKLEATSPEMLKVALRGYDLSSRQISAACKRLTMLKNYVKNSRERYNNMSRREEMNYSGNLNRIIPDTIRAIPDNDFDKLDFDQLGTIRNDDDEANRKNIKYNSFTLVGSFYYTLRKRIDNRETKKALVPKKIVDRNMFALTEKNIRQADKWLTDGKSVTNWRGSSDNFRKIAEQIEKYKQFCLKNRDKPLTEEHYKTRCALLKKISEAADNYVVNKERVLAEKHKEPTPYQDARIKYAKELRAETAEMAGKTLFETVTTGMTNEEKRRCADGMHDTEDRKIDEFNARMRREALKIAELQKNRINTEPISEEAGQPEQPGIHGMII